MANKTMNELYTAMRKIELCHVTPGIRRVCKETLEVYRSAVKHIAEVVISHWDEISSITGSQARQSYVESLIHRTVKNPDPEDMDFDRLYYKFPSYLRRSAISKAIGIVSSYTSNYDRYISERDDAMKQGKKFRNRPPRLNLDTNICPSLYKGNLFSLEGNRVKIKVYIRNTWDFIELKIPGRDYKDLVRASAKGKVMSPMLVFAYNKIYLHFPIRYDGTKFQDTGLSQQKAMGVDLGINHGAVVSTVTKDGTVLHRAFDPFGDDRDRLDRAIELIREKASSSGKGSKLSAVYTKLSGLKDNYACQLAHWIVDQAEISDAYCIVLEHLGKMKGRGRRKDRIHHWCKKRIMALVKGMAFRKGIRVFIINPKNTSALAYDGSGKVVRDNDNHALCTFSSGKRYNCDLSASYNIAARYFVRQMRRKLPTDMWKSLSAKVPEADKGTECTLSTLWKLSGAETAA